ncbi:MAG: hypothetical protein KAW09_06600 [Thermoplasmata archaeon]|nr:hypothetical protein [Thermoplasmata archaeon]
MVKLPVLKGWIERLLKVTESGLTEYDVAGQTPYVVDNVVEGVNVVLFAQFPKELRDIRMYSVRFSNEGRLLAYRVVEFARYLDDEVIAELTQARDRTKVWEKLWEKIEADFKSKW